MEKELTVTVGRPDTMNVTVGSPGEASVTVGWLEELREVAEGPRALEEGLRVAVSGVRVSQVQELLALVRDQVEAQIWSIDDDEAVIAALEAAADGSARLEKLSHALGAVVRDTEEGIPVPASGPRAKLLRELGFDVCTADRPPPFLPLRYTFAGIEALGIGKQAEVLSHYRFSGGKITPESLECSTAYFHQTSKNATARIARLLGITIPFENPIIHISNGASTSDATNFSNSHV